jgi:hypothetical protein
MFTAPLLYSHSVSVAMTKSTTPLPRNATREQRALHFIERAKQIHKDTYDYSQVLTTFAKQQGPVVIVCRQCGPFKQLATNHLSGKGCQTCAAKLRMQARFPKHHAALLEGNKICGACNQIKALSNFSTNLKRKGAVSGWCKKCENNKKQTVYKDRIRNSNLKKYGITNEEYLILLEKQNFLCKICGIPSVNAPGIGASSGILCVDHDHKTQKIRGLLCSRCNTGLGLFFDDVFNLEKAIGYLNETR